jgi:hypothetical protein
MYVAKSPCTSLFLFVPPSTATVAFSIAPPPGTSSVTCVSVENALSSSAAASLATQPPPLMSLPSMSFGSMKSRRGVSSEDMQLLPLVACDSCMYRPMKPGRVASLIPRPRNFETAGTAFPGRADSSWRRSSCTADPSGMSLVWCLALLCLSHDARPRAAP